MAKSASSAMTAVTDFAKATFAHNITSFMVAGGSKRGWTTWLVAAVDPRVVAIAPIVFDMLNFTAGVKHMFRAYGGWTFAFQDYVRARLQRCVRAPLAHCAVKSLGCVLVRAAAGEQ
jgi:PhoPQ-activated pathogenicity-related protein